MLSEIGYGNSNKKDFNKKHFYNEQTINDILFGQPNQATDGLLPENSFFGITKEGPIKFLKF